MAFMFRRETKQIVTGLDPSANQAKRFLNTTYACAYYFMMTVYMHHCVCSDPSARFPAHTPANGIVNSAFAAGIA